MLSTQRARIVALILTASGAVLLFFALVPPIAQAPAYHGFADGRGVAGIPNFLNVISNLPFLAMGLRGLFLLGQGRLVHDNLDGFPVYAVFFTGVALTSLGSSWYHLAPGNGTLVWDRLPMALSFAALTTAVLSEHLEPGIERWLLYPLVGFGGFSVLYWYLTELQGRGDLRPYAVVQFLPMLMVPLIFVLFQSRFTRRGNIYLVMGFYVLAKLAEHLDLAIFTLTSAVSGHTLKHLLAALGVMQVLRMLELRRKEPQS